MVNDIAKALGFSGEQFLVTCKPDSMMEIASLWVDGDQVQGMWRVEEQNRLREVYYSDCH